MTEPEVPISSGGAVLGTNRRSKRIGKRKEDLKTGIFFKGVPMSRFEGYMTTITRHGDTLNSE